MEISAAIVVRNEENSMDKKTVRGYIILGVLFVVFSTIVFALPLPKNVVFWIAYISGVIAIIFQVYFFNTALSDGAGPKSRFYGFPIARVGAMYLFFQIMASIIEIGLARWIVHCVWLAVIVNILILGLAVIGCIVTETMRDEIENQDINLKNKVTNMRTIQSMAYSLSGLSDDKDIKELLKKVADELKYSDPVSSEQTIDIEKELETMINDLQEVVINKDYDSVIQLSDRILARLSERNRLCKLSK